MYYDEEFGDLEAFDEMDERLNYEVLVKNVQISLKLEELEKQENPNESELNITRQLLEQNETLLRKIEKIKAMHKVKEIQRIREVEIRKMEMRKNSENPDGFVEDSYNRRMKNSHKFRKIEGLDEFRRVDDLENSNNFINSDNSDNSDDSDNFIDLENPNNISRADYLEYLKASGDLNDSDDLDDSIDFKNPNNIASSKNSSDEKKENEFIKELKTSYKEYALSLIGTIIVFLTVFVVTIFLSGSVMGIFGFEYENLMTLILFFIATSIFSAPFEAGLSFVIAILLYKKIFNMKIGRLVFFLTDMFIVFVIMNLVDKMMVGINGNTIAFLIISLIMAVPRKDNKHTTSLPK